MTYDTIRLTDQLRRILEGEAWHGPAVLELLADVSAEQAASHPIPGAHSIWELVLHLTSDYSLVLRRMAGDGRGLLPDEGWPPCPAPTEANWQETIAGLKRLSHQLRDAVRKFPAERLDELLVAESPWTAYMQFIGVTQHNAYHAGQIALLKRALAEDPAPQERRDGNRGSGDG
ncbi:MAG TPA: DinB family protein [Gemmatimonadales bacterium]|nr:DinB family protein [Gemmatimonadales bacterium]